MARIPVILDVDVEPDEHIYPLEQPSPWSGFEVLANQMGGFRRRLETATGEPARFTWSIRMDPQIAEAYGSPTWAVDRFGPIFQELRDRGDALGIHPHAWRWDGSSGWVTDHGDQGWVNRCVETSFEAYTDAFGETPTHHRFGGQFTSTATMNLLRRIGIPVDLTLEPGLPPMGPGEYLGGVRTGETPDLAESSRELYQPDPRDSLLPTEGSADGLWAIPLSSGNLVLKPLPITTEVRLGHPINTARRIAGRARHRVLASRRPQVESRPQNRTLQMWLNWRSPADFWDSAFEVAEGLERPYMAFAIRSDIPIRDDLRRNFDAIMNYLFEDPRAQRLVFTTPEDCLGRLGLEKHEAQAH